METQNLPRKEVMSETFTKLSNGLKVHLKEIHTAPIISHWIWYRVGSRDEVSGKTGISHWVEHMQFKGTPQYPGSVMDKAMSREGGFWNAFTFLDWTAYFQVLPENKIDLALRLEADRMVNSVFDIDEVESERMVILSEREGNENSPLFRLGKAVQRAAFDVHPYQHEIIGLAEDIKQITRDDLYNHYRDYYVPNNALLSVAGNFKTTDMLDRIAELYCDVELGKKPRRPARPEPETKDERRIEVTGPGGTCFLQLAYRSPAASILEFHVMTVIDSLLTGPTGLNMFGGGGISNKTSRLYRALVEKEYAVGVNGGLQATIDPFLYTITVAVHPDQSFESALIEIDNQVHELQNKLVRGDEIKRAIKQARALFAYGSENITNQAFWLGYADMFADYNWFKDYVDNLETTTPEDIQRVARSILRPSNRVVGVYLPTGAEEEVQ
jgi:zinc protease